MLSQFVVPLGYGANLVIEVDTSGLAAHLTMRQKRAEDIAPLLNAIAGVIREAFGKRFAEGGNPAWKPLAPSTIAAKMLAKQPARTAKGNVPTRLVQNGSFGAANILIRSGALRDSLRQKGAKGHKEVIDANAGTVEVSSTLKYARWVLRGTGPYIIRAKPNGKPGHTLTFGNGQGETLFRRVVHHPGLTARPVTLTKDDLRQIQTMMAAYMAGEELPKAA